MDIKEKVAVITGGASGIGLATAKKFAAHGAQLVLADIEEGPLALVVTELRAGGVEVVGAHCDVRREDDVLNLRDVAVNEFGTAHIVFNNAGVAAGSAIGTSKKVWDWVMDVNVGGVINGMNAFLPLLLEQNEGHIINTASLAGLGGVPGMAPYNASKFAVVGICESLFYDLQIRQSNVKVSALCPGFVKTRIHESTRNLPSDLRSYAESPEAAFMNDMAKSFVEAGIEVETLADAVYDAVDQGHFWILTHHKAAVRTTEKRAQWMATNDAPPLGFDGVTQP